MPTQEQLNNGFRIGDWEVLPARRVMRRGDEEIAPEPKVWGVLMSLALRGGDVVTRDELVDEVWEGRATGDEPINRCISQLRKHLGDTRPYRYIKPVTGSGYLLQETVTLLESDNDAIKRKEWRPRRQLWPIILFVAVIAVAASLILNPLSSPDGPIRSIVVLPFENASGDPKDQYLTSGFRDELVSTLQRIRDFSVKTGRDPYPDRSPEDIGRTFGVDSVLRGYVQRSGDELKVSYEVTRSSNGEVIAASGITDSVQRVFDVQERLAGQVRDHLFGSSKRHLVSASRPSNFDAYDSYLQGTYAFERRTGRNLEDAIELFERTIELDSRFGPAYLQLATATALMPAYLGADVISSNQRAVEIVEQGIVVDDSIEAAAGAVFGFVYHSQKDWAKSELAYQQATNAEVVDANAFNWYSRMLASVGRLDAALEQALEALELDRDNAVINSRVAMSYFWLGDAHNAGRFFERSRRLGAEGTTHLLGYSLFLASQGEIDDARAVGKVAATEAGLSQESIDAVLQGIEDPELAGPALEAVNMTVATGQLTPQIEVVARTMLGDLDGAMEVTRLLLHPGEAFEMDLLWIPQFLPLRQRPEFLDLMRQLGVAEYWDLHGCRFEDASVICPSS
ncbi:MAG: winged helix-turn-helix domain-containing protein [Gammaproteobacteria bacterium]|nr:winged helix-turn-helix domain-containing protein [Gammaproteobacteria bacterium]